MSTHPNLIIILADQLRRQALGCYGDPNVATPHIDALAARGCRFAASCSTYPVCVPFRFTMMTGLYGHSRNIPTIGWQMDPAERSMADHFNAAGYHTCYIGKWHLDGCRPRDPIPRERQARWQKWLGFELRNSHFDTWYFEDDDPRPKPIVGYQTDGLFNLAMGHLGQDRPNDRPFCTVISVEPPHFPYEAPEAYLERWRDRDLELPASFEEERDYFCPEQTWDAPDAPEVAHKQDRLRTYYAMIENLDDNVGRLQHWLSDQGLADNTAIMMLADHGEMGGMHDHPTAQKETSFEEAIGIPWICAGPGIPAGLVIDEPTCSEDILPSCLGLCGLPADPALPGSDCSVLMRGEHQELGRDGILLEMVHEHRPRGAFYGHSMRAIRDRRWKYSLLRDADGVRPWQLFDLERDPLERRNLLLHNAAAHADQARAMDARLRGLLQQAGDAAWLDQPIEAS